MDAQAAAAVTSESLASELLGLPTDTRVLIVNCDDLGMHESVNAAVFEAVQEGIASSASLMVPCPAAEQAMQMLGRTPSIPFGIHLTLTRDGLGHRWAPVAPAAHVPSLVDENGLLLTSASAPQLLAQARLEDVERELRAQIDMVACNGLTPTHLDWHVLADGGRPDVLDLTMALAHEHGLAARVWLEPGRRTARGRGLPVVDHDFLDSFALPVAGKAERYMQALRSLPVGLSEWAVHPAVGEETAAEADLGWTVRRSDHAFLSSRLARHVIDEEDIVVIEHRGLQDVWGGRACISWTVRCRCRPAAGSRNDAAAADRRWSNCWPGEIQRASLPGIRLLQLQTRERAVPRHRIFATPFASVYPHYIAKVERKGRTRDEVDEAICWLTGYDAAGLAAALEDQWDFEVFFDRAPAMTPQAALITGSICGVRVENIEDPLMRKIRMLDKLIDEIAKGRPMIRVLRSGNVSRSVV